MQQLAAVNPILISFLRLLCGYHRFHFVCLLMAGMFTLYPFFPSWLSLLSFDIQISLKKKSLFYATADLEKRVGAIKEEGLKGFFFFLWKAKQLISSSVPYINSINALISKKFLCISFFSAVNFSSNCILPPHKLIKSHQSICCCASDTVSTYVAMFFYSSFPKPMSTEALTQRLF